MIYIYCQANRATGGTELLHQMGYKLRLMGYEATMVYYPANPNTYPVCTQFKKYNVPYTFEAEDTPDNIVVIPEVALGYILAIKNAKRILWWLSVDNAPLSENAISIIKNDKQLIHCCQSYYAMDFCRKTFFCDSNNNLSDEDTSNRLFYLSDYINSIFLVPYDAETKREDIVLYNPVKGYEYTSKIIAASDDRITWKALQGMTPEEMRNAMNTAKVYIDFGNHPGKDRIPREAALNGCLIITNKQGAAAYKEDVYITDDLKFGDEATAEEIIEKIYALVENYDNYLAKYEDYVEKTKREYMDFETDLYKIMSKISISKISTDSKTDKGSDCNQDLPNCDSSNQDSLITYITEQISTGNITEAFKNILLYKTLGYEENETFSILEATVRIEIGEYAEAHYCTTEALKKYPENYELYLCLIQACLGLGKTDDIDELVGKALEYSKGTEDEDAVKDIISSLI